MYAASPPLNRVLMGTSDAPARTAPRAATIHSHTFGAQIATRSPRTAPLEAAARAVCSTRAASSANVIRSSPSTTAGASPNRAAASSTSPGMAPHRRSPRCASVIAERLHDLREPVQLPEHHVPGPVREPEHRLAHPERGEVLELAGVRHRAERLHLHGVGVAPALLVRAPQLRQRRLDPAAPDRHPPVAVLGHRREELRSSLATHEERRPRLLHRLGPREGRLDVHELAMEPPLLLRPERPHRPDLLPR